MHRLSNILAAHAPRRRGFTFVELMLALMVTALVMAALGALLAAVAQGWKQSEGADSSSNLTAHTHLRMQRTLKSARLIGAIRPGSIDGSALQGAALLIWKNDNNYDWRIQFSEMALLEHAGDGEADDPETLRYYQVSWPAGMTTEAKAAADFTLADNDELYEDSNIEYFKSIADVQYTILTRHVLGCTFHKNDSYATTRPSIEYRVQVEEASGAQTELGTVSLRTPATMPASQR